MAPSKVHVGRLTPLCTHDTVSIASIDTIRCSSLWDMKVTIRNPVRREIQVQGKRRVSDLLKELDLNLESHIVIRDRELLTSEDLLLDNDHVEVLSAISGG